MLKLYKDKKSSCSKRRHLSPHKNRFWNPLDTWWPISICSQICDKATSSSLSARKSRELKPMPILHPVLNINWYWIVRYCANAPTFSDSGISETYMTVLFKPKCEIPILIDLCPKSFWERDSFCIVDTCGRRLVLSTRSSPNLYQR